MPVQTLADGDPVPRSSDESRVNHRSQSSHTAPPQQSRAGLEYSRHYADVLRERGRSNKDNWIERLWDPAKMRENGHISGDKKSLLMTGHVAGEEGGYNYVQGEDDDSNLSNNEMKTSDTRRHRMRKSQTRERQVDENFNDKSRIPEAIVGDRSNVRQQNDHNKTSPSYVVKTTGSGDQHVGRLITSQDSRRHQWNSKQQQQSRNYRKQTHPFLSQQQAQADVWKPHTTRDAMVIELDKRAKSMVEDAIMTGRIFTCQAPYPVDAYVRLSLRKRGWYEKFSSKINQTMSSSTARSDKFVCDKEEDFLAVCEQNIPAPWVEDYGIYAIVSRLIRHCHARFIWGAPGVVNNLTLRNDVIVNHFQKARHFSSKVLIVQSLRELLWLQSVDPNTFFPRCYILSEEDKEDFIEDFTLTACMSMIRTVIRQYTQRPSESGDEKKTSTRCKVKYEEVVFDENKTRTTLVDDKYASSDGNKMSTHYPAASSNETANENPLISNDEDNTNGRQRDNFIRNGTSSSRRKIANNDDNCTDEQDSSDANGTDMDGTHAMGNNEHNEKNDEDDEINNNTDEDANTTENANPENDVNASNAKDKRVRPDLHRYKKRRRGGEISVNVMTTALQLVNKWITGKQHEDIDDTQTKQMTDKERHHLLKSCYAIYQNGAIIKDLTDTLFNEAQAAMEKLKDLWPQYGLDGCKNIWIVKPGDKSKGIGIEFCDQLDTILKYANNSSQQGHYVAQKYVERPLLIHKCKFDIRQWFLVTDWNPLTVWFYKDSYLRICSQEYDLDVMHVAIHLSNVAVQENYLNGQRSNKLPDDNFMTSSTFKQYLREQGAGDAWDNITYPGMKEVVVNTLMATQDVNENRKTGFELYGADFIVTDDYRPWLLEVNASPGMSPSSLEKAKLCAAVIEDTIKVVLDYRSNNSCNTGRFELAFRDTVQPMSHHGDVRLLVEGKSVKKGDLARYSQIDAKFAKQEQKRTKQAAAGEKSSEEKPSLATVDNNTASQAVTAGGDSDISNSNADNVLSES